MAMQCIIFVIDKKWIGVVPIKFLIFFRIMTKIFLFFILFILSANYAIADCRTDKFGEVYCGKGKCEIDKDGKVLCSKYRYGDAVINKYGNVVCGKGKCRTGQDFNDYFCSKIEDGGASVDHFGVVKCYGGCEQASSSMCESEKGIK